MKRLFTFCLILGWLIALGAQTGYGQTRPDWVYHPPRISSHLVSIGVAKPYLDDSLTFALARQHAVQNLVKQSQVHVVTKLAESERGVHIRTVGYTKEIIDSSAYVQCRTNTKVLDSVLTEQSAYILMTVRQDLSPPDSNLNIQFSSSLNSAIPEPEWITTPPVSAGTVYGIGISGSYRREADSWDYAAKYARRDIAMTLMTEKSTLRRDMESDAGNVHFKWSEDAADITLGLNRIVERWYDPKNGLFYCLVAYRR